MRHNLFILLYTGKEKSSLLGCGGGRDKGTALCHSVVYGLLANCSRLINGINDMKSTLRCQDYVEEVHVSTLYKSPGLMLPLCARMEVINLNTSILISETTFPYLTLINQVVVKRSVFFLIIYGMKIKLN